MKHLIFLAAFSAATMAANPGAFAKNIEDATPTPAPIISTELSGNDVTFLKDSPAQMALLIQLSQMADTRSVTPEVKALAATVLKDQTDTLAKLKDVAKQNGVSIDANPDKQGKKTIAKLSKLTGILFDKAFLDAQGDIDDALQTSLQAGTASSNADIKAAADSALTALKAERDQLRKLGI
jgi:putative membrane protein